MKYLCPWGYEYDPIAGDPDNGIAPGTPWEEVPEDFLCPICGLGKEAFEEIQYNLYMEENIMSNTLEQKQNKI